VIQTLPKGRYQVANLGVPTMAAAKGAEKSYWNHARWSEMPTFEPNIVVLALGTNDSKPETWAKTGDAFAGDYRAMIDAIRAIPSSPRVLVATPPSLFPEKFKPNYTVDKEILDAKVRPAILKVAAEAGCPVIDFHALTRDKPEWFPDGVHPGSMDGPKEPWLEMGRLIGEVILAAEKSRNGGSGQ
jgi:lysophospholipase L1-like esterase